MHKSTKWLTMMAGILLNMFAADSLFAQAPVKDLSLEQAYTLARANYPLIQQKDLINKTAFLSIENMQTAFLPQISLNGQASYQSDVTSLKIPVPNFSMTPMSKDQYRFWGELNQLIYDGGITKSQKKLQERIAEVDNQKLEVELYKLKDRINQLYLGILLMEAQIKQVKLSGENIQIGLNTVQAQITNGTAFKSAALVLEAQLLQNEQRMVELFSNKKSLIQVLSLFIQVPLSESVKLQSPIVADLMDTTLHRPEIKLYAYQDSFWHVQQQMLQSKSNPKFSFFAQAGYGRPGLNMLNNDFTLFGIGGLRLNWSFNSLYTHKREKEIIILNQKMNGVQKEVFVFNTQTQLAQQIEEIRKLQDLSTIDQKIITVRSKITEAAKAQLQNAVINANDYLREINAEDQAKNTFILHQTQLLQAQLNFQTTKGNR